MTGRSGSRQRAPKLRLGSIHDQATVGDISGPCAGGSGEVRKILGQIIRFLSDGVRIGKKPSIAGLFCYEYLGWITA